MGKIFAALIKLVPRTVAKLMLGFMLRGMMKQMGMTAKEMVPAMEDAVKLLRGQAVDYAGDIARQERAEGIVEILEPAFAEFGLSITAKDVEPLLVAVGERLKAFPG